MDERTERHPITMKKVVYELAGMDAVRAQRDVEYQTADAGVLVMDLYYPPAIARLKASRSFTQEGEPLGRAEPASRAVTQEGEPFRRAEPASRAVTQEGDPFRRAEPATAGGAPIPAMVIVAGYSDVGYEKFTGCRFNDAEFSISWARLLAASGLVAITYTNREPAADLQTLVRHVRGNAASLGIDPDRIGIWASSGNAPLALSLLMQAGTDFLKCAVLCYAFTLDLDGSTAIAEAAATWKFANPGVGRSLADLPQDLPLFIARAGRDEFPGLNGALDRFAAHALARNLPLTFVNHPTGPHAFDLVDDSDTSREIVRQILAFARYHLLR